MDNGDLSVDITEGTYIMGKCKTNPLKRTPGNVKNTFHIIADQRVPDGVVYATTASFPIDKLAVGHVTKQFYNLVEEIHGGNPFFKIIT